EGRAAVTRPLEPDGASGAPLPPPVALPSPPNLGLRDLLSARLLPSMVVGSVVLITINALIFGFVNWLPTFFVQQGLSVTRSLGYTLVIVSGSLIGCAMGAFLADTAGRRRTIIGASLLAIVFGRVSSFFAPPAAGVRV